MRNVGNAQSISARPFPPSLHGSQVLVEDARPKLDPRLCWSAYAGPRTCFPRPKSLTFPPSRTGPTLLLYPGAFQSKLRAVGCTRHPVSPQEVSSGLVLESSNVGGRSELDMVSWWLATWTTGLQCTWLMSVDPYRKALAHNISHLGLQNMFRRWSPQLRPSHPVKTSTRPRNISSVPIRCYFSHNRHEWFLEIYQLQNNDGEDLSSERCGPLLRLILNSLDKLVVMALGVVDEAFYPDHSSIVLQPGARTRRQNKVASALGDSEPSLSAVRSQQGLSGALCRVGQHPYPSSLYQVANTQAMHTWSDGRMVTLGQLWVGGGRLVLVYEMWPGE
ncbi:hypothetical protein BU15DRAFT_67843 [Melanogaster broomeanus]|nr:hypothetical protein BU15DRAFT_67843 [Melanogaster broomeanus]